MIKITENRLDWFLQKFKEKRIIVLGDLMLDRYVWGVVERISPEAPVPVIEVTNETTRLGGAANVAHNLASLGATPIPIGVIGNDQSGKQLIDLMQSLGFDVDSVIVDENRPTVVKTRLIANDQQVVRADRESRETIDSDILKKIIGVISKNINNVDAFIIEDYNKGLLTKQLISEVIELANKHKKVITVDPKFDNFLEYKSVTLFKPNRKETETALGIKIDSQEKLKEACQMLIERLKCKAVLITLGDQGMCLLRSNGEFIKFPTKARKVHDVSGAGDTVISTLTLCLTTGVDIKEAITLANYAAGAVCSEVGVVPIGPLKLKETIRYFNGFEFEN